MLKIINKYICGSNGIDLSTIVMKEIMSYTPEKAIDILFSMIKDKALSLESSNSLRFLFELDNRIYTLTGQESVRYGNGIHTKHRHIKYHDFFIKHVRPGEKILDIGCGNGFLAYDVVTHREDAYLTGIDMNETNISFAKANYSHPRLSFRVGNALIDLPGQSFDVVILSNVLEHIENRVEFLRDVMKVILPSRFLLRVPLFERDWRVPLMKELGIDYRLDKTHFVEYVYEDFVVELQQADLSIVEKEFKWGELWCVVK